MRKAIATLALASLIAVPAAAQKDTAAASQDSTFVPIIAQSFTGGSGEYLRVELVQGHQYRLSTNYGRVRFTVSPVKSSVQQPYLNTTVPGSSVTGGSLWDLRPYETAMYEIRVRDFPAGNTATLTLYEKRPVPKEPHE